MLRKPADPDNKACQLSHVLNPQTNYSYQLEHGLLKLDSLNTKYNTSKQVVGTLILLFSVIFLNPLGCCGYSPF